MKIFVEGILGRHMMAEISESENNSANAFDPRAIHVSDCAKWRFDGFFTRSRVSSR
jgi:hypothetical protein